MIYRIIDGLITRPFLAFALVVSVIFCLPFATRTMATWYEAYETYSREPINIEGLDCYLLADIMNTTSKNKRVQIGDYDLRGYNLQEKFESTQFKELAKRAKIKISHSDIEDGATAVTLSHTSDRLVCLGAIHRDPKVRNKYRNGFGVERSAELGIYEATMYDGKLKTKYRIK